MSIFSNREIDLGEFGDSGDDLAIITGVVYNAKHARDNDSMVKAAEEGRLEEYLQVQKNNRDYQNKIISIGLEIPIEEVDETITHPIVRARLVYAIPGGAVPYISRDGAVIAHIVGAKPIDLYRWSEQKIWQDAIRYWQPDFKGDTQLQGEYFKSVVGDGIVERSLKHASRVWNALFEGRDKRTSQNLADV